MERTFETPAQECRGPRSQPHLGRQQGQGDGCRTWGDPQTKKIRNPGSLDLREILAGPSVVEKMGSYCPLSRRQALCLSCLR